ncbi:MAG: polyribonucleotide nucleotidyltransferase [Chlorobi bacterium]|nr:polyribonucleotide nucleotidyltransferase [Chlorobiota bacterium]
MKHTKKIEIGGRTLLIETGHMARQADGAAMVTYGETMVLASVVAAHEPREGIDYFPLQVEYREKTSAAGKIPGGFFKREGRPAEIEVLSSRIIDRTIRPMFPDGFRCETQVVVSVYSADQQNHPDTLGAIAASTALMISDIPFDGPIAEVRVARVNGEFVVNPTYDMLEDSDIEVVIGGTEESIVMVEGEAKEVSEQDMLEAIRLGQEAIADICRAQKEFAAELNPVKREIEIEEAPEGLEEKVTALVDEKVKELVNTVMTKEERSTSMKEIAEECIAALEEEFPEQEKFIKGIIHDVEKKHMREMILSKKKRLDGRSPDDIRPITCEVGLLPRTHGSALFTRGETQSLTTITLGTKSDQQIIDGLLEEYTKRFMLHYNFPPFSVGEVGRIGFTSRREIGHGNLAERALKRVIPSEEDFPYTIRVVSDILESNGSSSMATVCAGSLGLMDAGVPITKAVAGIAMGLIKEEDEVVILTDILGNEDHLGDMDFKVAGTQDGITAYQMDIKVKGISFAIMSEALDRAREARLKILEVMNATIDKPREELSKYAPRLTTIQVPIDMIGDIIGPGGKMIKKIVAESGATVDITDDGRVIVASVDQESAQIAIKMIEALIQVPEAGEVYTGIVKKITDFGAFVEILPNKEGLLHISEIEHRRIESVDEVLKVGDEVTVKLLKVEDNGKMSLSRKALLERPDGMPEEKPRRRPPDRSGHGDKRRGGGHGRSRSH